MVKLHNRKSVLKSARSRLRRIDQKKKCGDTMFARKKKKSKLWLAIPFALIFAAGLWLNSGLEDEGSGILTDENNVQAGSGQYYEENISDLAGQPDVSLNDIDEETSGKANTSETDPWSDSFAEDDRSDTGVDHQEDIGGEDDPGYDLSGYGQYEENRQEEQDVPDQSEAGKITVIAESDGSVVIIRYDSGGRELSRSRTSILLSMLTETDRKLFSRGITVSDESELSELLQDFEG